MLAVEDVCVLQMVKNRTTAVLAVPNAKTLNALVVVTAVATKRKTSAISHLTENTTMPR
jgi:hypothetical protein